MRRLLLRDVLASNSNIAGVPDGGQQRDMHCFCVAWRFVYNQALALQKTNYEVGANLIGYAALARSLTVWRNGPDTPWLKARPCHALKDLDRAYKNFFAKRAGFACVQRKGRGQSFR